MGVSRISQRVQEEKAAVEVALKNAGLDPTDAEWIKARQEIDDAAKQAQADKVDIPKERGKKFIIQEIKVDPHNMIRRMIELTPSMCRERNCGFDAAKQIGYMSGWTTVPTGNLLPSGQRLGEALLGLLEHHVKQAHGAINTHILSEEEVANLGGWAPMPGQDPFLQGAKE